MMSTTRGKQSPLEDFKINVRIKISTLWATLMFCYLYADYFELYVPGKLTGMLDGIIGPLGQVTQAKLVGTAILLAIPTLMIFLSIGLPARIARCANIIFGMIYTAVAVATIASPGAWIFYQIFCAVEIFLTILIIGYAWQWPRKLAIND